MDHRTSPCTAILGGTKGLGSCIADECLERQQKVMVFGRSGFREHAPAGAYDTGVEVDLRNEKSVKGASQTLITFYRENGYRYRRVYWVAGLLHRGGFGGTLRVPALLEMIDVNLRNALLFLNDIWQLAQNDSEPYHLIVVSSTTGLSDKPRPDEAIYAATKAAQISFARALGKSNPDPQCKVSLFCPGGMQTEFWTDKPDVDTSSFLDPKKVAAKIVEAVEAQTDSYFELAMPRGSL